MKKPEIEKLLDGFEVVWNVRVREDKEYDTLRLIARTRPDPGTTRGRQWGLALNFKTLTSQEEMMQGIGQALQAMGRSIEAHYKRKMEIQDE